MLHNWIVPIIIKGISNESNTKCAVKTCSISIEYSIKYRAVGTQ